MVTAALVFAEAAYEFEHQDLHWGNILLSRNECATVQFALEGKKIYMKTFELAISIIDFTFSRINIGNNSLVDDMLLPCSRSNYIPPPTSNINVIVYNLQTSISNCYQLFLGY
ncbi:hypothetical protein K2173_009518 [Erythroxylum novogranatense]|uniref:Protein kinase domain-containing protein n=1 Tax=Erythroxylum novogranatense TaxID=1862640 RepID=A0AAV8U460_9ROSI|nr:hypothetical protein K2173_009518 [Erythroxylum novogranatense]